MFKQILGKCDGHLKLGRKLLLIFLLLFFVFGSMALHKSRCTLDLDTLPIQIIRGNKYGNVTTFSAEEISNTPLGFSPFVRNVTEQLTAKLAQKKLCLNSVKSKERSLLQFLPMHVISEPPPLLSVPPISAQSSIVCRISSPWVDLVVERKPIPSVRGVFRYSERQLLADQALLAGARNVSPGVAMPLTYEEFRWYADSEYAPSEVHHLPAKKPIEERVPPDLLWLFQRARQDGDYIFFGGALGSMGKAMGTGSNSYTQIVITLIDRCFESEGVEIRYNNILDIDDSILLEQYKIKSSLIPILEHIDY